jgi:alpha-amylase
MKPSAKQSEVLGKRLVLYFQVHQPLRLNKLSFFEVGQEKSYFDDDLNREIIQRVAAECYLPANEMLIEVARKVKNLRLTFSISGLALRQFARYEPKVIDSFKRLHDTGCVEFLGETSHHSLASLHPSDEFPEQVREHLALMQEYFGVRPTVFRNTELVYSNSIGTRVANMGFKGMLIDGVDRVLGGRSNYQVYQHPFHGNFKLLQRANNLSDDIGFRFIEGQTRLSAEKYFQALNQVPDDNGVITLGMDYETFGEHRKKETGIIDFLRDLILTIDREKTLKMATPSEVITEQPVKDRLDVPDFISWADKDKDISAWLGNEAQKDAFQHLYNMEESVRKAVGTKMLETWRDLQASDHLYYMSTKASADGEVHSYFSPYSSPYEAFINYMNILNDFMHRLKTSAREEHLETVEYERRHQEVPGWAREQYAEGFGHNSLISH